MLNSTKFRNSLVIYVIMIISSFIAIFSSVNLIILNIFVSMAPMSHPQLNWIPSMLNLMMFFSIFSGPILLLIIMHHYIKRRERFNDIISQNSKKILGVRYNIILKVILALGVIISLFFLGDLFRFLISTTMINLNIVQIGDQVYRLIFSYLFFLVGIYTIILIKYSISLINKSPKWDFYTPLFDKNKHKNKIFAIFCIYLGIILIYICGNGLYGYISYLLSLPFSIPDIDLVTAEGTRNVLFGLFIGILLIVMCSLYLNSIRKSLEENPDFKQVRVEKKRSLLILGYILFGAGGILTLIGGFFNMMLLQALIMTPVAVVGPNIDYLISQYIGVLLPICGIIFGLFLVIPLKKYVRIEKS